MSDLKKEVQEAPLLWPLTPIPTFEEVYDPKICTEASREISTIFEGWLHPKHEMAKPEALGKIRILECGHGGLQVNSMFGGAYMSELGANVIMVEPPGGSPIQAGRLRAQALHVQRQRQRRPMRRHLPA
jgi:hypothetical protein